MMNSFLVSLVTAYLALQSTSFARAEVAQETAYVEIGSEPSADGNHSIIYYGADPNAKKPLPSGPKLGLHARKYCKPEGASLACDSDNAARNEVCERLAFDLNTNGEVKLGKDPRQICYQGDGDDNYCCASWSTAYTDLKKKDVAYYVNRMLAQCTQNGVSGKIVDAGMQGVCSSVCLSSRGTHCS